MKPPRQNAFHKINDWNSSSKNGIYSHNESVHSEPYWLKNFQVDRY